MAIDHSLSGNQAMSITKTALAAAFLAVMAVSAQAQQGPTRQIQVLPAPVKQAQAPVAATTAAPAKVEGEAPAEAAPAEDAAPAAEEAPAPAPKALPKGAPKVLVAAPVDVKPAPKFVEPKFAPPVRRAYGHVSYGHGGYKRIPTCHWSIGNSWAPAAVTRPALCVAVWQIR